MSSHAGSKPNHERTTEPDESSLVEFAANPGAPKLTFPLERWAQTALGVVALLAAVAGAVRPLIRTHLDRDRQAETLGRFTEVQAAENQKHTGEDSDETIPVLSHNGGEKIQLKHYASDGCFLVLRSTPDGVVTSRLWVPRFSGAEMTPAPGPVGNVQYVETGAVTGAKEPALAARLADRLPLATALAFAAQSGRVEACGGRCTEHHSGAPITTYAKTHGCWVQVVRTWRDGCSQYQWYDACHSVWDPKIYWTCCRD
jgi:hypothetical protein